MGVWEPRHGHDDGQPKNQRIFPASFLDFASLLLPLPALPIPPPSSPPAEAPWHAGLRAARANLVPGLLVQALMIGTVLAYFYAPSTREIFDTLADWKSRWSYAYSSVTAIIAGAIVPELLRILVFQKGRPERRNLGNFLFAAVFWGYNGIQVDALYRLQAFVFGNEADFLTVLKKVLVDQLIYCPFVAAPLSVIAYDWRAHGFRREVLPGFFTRGFYRDSILPTLFANWGVWIPIVAALYSLPSLLQIPLFSLALSLWVILFTWMSEQRASGNAAVS